jgi:hypothetical protein
MDFAARDTRAGRNVCLESFALRGLLTTEHARAIAHGALDPVVRLALGTGRARGGWKRLFTSERRPEALRCDRPEQAFAASATREARRELGASFRAARTSPIGTRRAAR